MSYDNNSWDFIRYSRTNWEKYLVFALHDLYHQKKPLLAYSSDENKENSIEVLIDCMIALAPQKPEEYADWFKTMSGTEMCGRLEDAEWVFMKELIADIYDVSWEFERGTFIKALLKDEVLPGETMTNSKSVAEAIIGVFIEKDDIAELALRIADFIQMDLLTRNNSMGAVANSMQMDGGKVLRLRKAFGLPKLSWGVLGILFYGYYSVIAPTSSRKKKNRLLLLCLVYLRNSYSLLANATSFTTAMKERLRQNDNEERITAALAYFEQVYDVFNSEKMLPTSVDQNSLLYQVFYALKEKYSFSLFEGGLIPPKEERIEVAKYLLEQINEEEKEEYENANERLWKEIDDWNNSNATEETHPKVLLADYCFPFISINEHFTIEKKESLSWGRISDELTKQYIDMLGYYDIYGELSTSDRFDFILLRKPDQDLQRRYLKHLAPHGKFLYSSVPNKTIAKEEVKNEIGNLIHRMGTFLTMSDQAVTELKNTISRPGKEQPNNVSIEDAARPLYTVLDVFDFITASIRLKNVTILGLSPKLKEENLHAIITDYYESRDNLFGNRFSLALSNNIPETMMVMMDKPDFFAILDELLKNSLKYAFDGIAPKERKVLIYANRVLYRDNEYALISVGDNGIGCSMPEADYFQIGKTSGGTGQGGDDVYSTVKSLGGHCHLRSKDELEENVSFMMDILLPIVKDNTINSIFNTYNYTTFEKL